MIYFNDHRAYPLATESTSIFTGFSESLDLSVTLRKCSMDEIGEDFLDF